MQRNFFVIFISVTLLASLCLCSCKDEAVEPTPADSTPPVTEQQADTAPQVNDEPQVTDEPQAGIEPQIPEDYQTYTDKTGFFSISYPAGWEPALHLLAAGEQYMKDYVKDLNENIPIEKASLIFFAGIPVQTGYLPNVNIVVEPLPEGMRTIEEVYKFEVAGVEMVVDDYTETSWEKAVIDGKEAIIMQQEYTVPNLSKGYFTQMLIVVDKNIWSVTCTELSEGEYIKWEDDFNNIVRSLRILK